MLVCFFQNMLPSACGSKSTRDLPIFSNFQNVSQSLFLVLGVLFTTTIFFVLEWCFPSATALLTALPDKQGLTFTTGVELLQAVLLAAYVASFIFGMAEETVSR